jgi:predicted negative regulator of RcsB-dependent stress response
MEKNEISRAPVPPSSSEATEPSEPLYELLDFLKANWKDLLVGVGLGLALVIAIGAWRARVQRKHDQAFIQYAAASTAAQFEEILEQFPRTKAAELSMLLAARAKYDQGRFEEADRLYADFLQKHPAHFLEPIAHLGRAHCREATGLLDEALADYRRLSAGFTNATAFLITARLGEARCLRQMGIHTDAIVVYDDLLAAHPESGWVPLINDLKETTEREARRLAAQSAPSIVAPGSPHAE